MAIGDSKTLGVPDSLATNGYQNFLLSSLNGFGGGGSSFVGVSAASGRTTAQALAALPTFIAAQVVAPTHVLINLGTNDLPGIRSGAITEASWTADMGAILDALHAAWSTVPIYLMRVYRSDYITEQNALDDTYIPAVLVGRSSWAFVGPDERDFLPGNVTDTTHPTNAAYSVTADRWQAVMGY